MFNIIEVLALLLEVIITVSEIAGVNNNNVDTQDGNQGKHIERQRRPVESIFTDLGNKHARYYQVEVASFNYLVEVLTPNIYQRTKKTKEG